MLVEFEGEREEEDFIFQIICRLKHVSRSVQYVYVEVCAAKVGKQNNFQLTDIKVILLRQDTAKDALLHWEHPFKAR